MKESDNRASAEVSVPSKIFMILSNTGLEGHNNPIRMRIITDRNINLNKTDLEERGMFL
jgi:ribosomal protein S28E/S33